MSKWEHPFYACGKFKAPTVDERKSTLTIIKASYNCLLAIGLPNAGPQTPVRFHTFMHQDQQIAPH